MLSDGRAAVQLWWEAAMRAGAGPVAVAVDPGFGRRLVTIRDRVIGGFGPTSRPIDHPPRVTESAVVDLRGATAGRRRSGVVRRALRRETSRLNDRRRLVAMG